MTSPKLLLTPSKFDSLDSCRNASRFSENKFNCIPQNKNFSAGCLQPEIHIILNPVTIFLQMESLKAQVSAQKKMINETANKVRKESVWKCYVFIVGATPPAPLLS